MALELLQFDYVQRALLAGLVVAVICSFLGVFVVLKRLSLIGDTLSHTAFAGVALGAFLNFTPILTALVVTVFSAMGITKVKRAAKVSGDAALAVFFSAGLAVGIVLISLTPRFTINLSSLLFGSILLVSWEDLWVIVGIGVVTIATILILFKELFYMTFDEDLARASGIPVAFLNYLLSILTGTMIVAAMRIVGILLVSAMLVIPTLSSIQISRSFKETFALATVFALTSVFLGLIVSLYANVAPGGSIVLTSIGIFLATVTYRNLGLRRPE